MVGGEGSDVERAHQLLRYAASNYTHMGPAQAGQTTNLIKQVLCGPGFLAVAEATQMALDAGVDVLKIPQALKGGRADSTLLQKNLLRLAIKDYRRKGRIDNMVKELNAVNDLMRQTGTSMPKASLCGKIHRMLTAAGLGGEDQAAVMEFFSEAHKGSAASLTTPLVECR